MMRLAWTILVSMMAYSVLIDMAVPGSWKPSYAPDLLAASFGVFYWITNWEINDETEEDSFCP